MMDESELRLRFARLREADQEHTPSFAQIYGRARARRSWRATPRVRPLVIGAAAAVAIGAVWIARVRSFSPSEIAPAIATWRAPTDVFLRTPGSELFGAMPALGASVLDTIIPVPSKRGT
ncbi:MAG: hypothetical protein M3P26_15320 [Gemmatimonadota bacterium]|nr:hypothetical protein [Gemmatimonadota bacterium]